MSDLSQNHSEKISGQKPNAGSKNPPAKNRRKIKANVETPNEKS
jgi:hypothetical protein